MIKHKIMIEIILVSIAGFITIGLSIKSIIESSRKDQELKKTQNDLSDKQNELVSKQNLLIDLQNRHAIELKEKTDEIIKLQALLQKQSDLQLTNLKRLENPLPEFVDITFESSIIFTNTEIEQIKKVLEMRSVHSNMLPFDSQYSNEAFDKISRFKDISFELSITFSNGEKKMEINFNRSPINIDGYNTTGSVNSFELYFLDLVRFEGRSLRSMEIKTNYKSPSLNDFEDSKVSIFYRFAFPEIMQVGGIASATMYSFNKYNDRLLLDFGLIRISHKNYSIIIKNIKKEGNLYFGTWSYEK